MGQFTTILWDVDGTLLDFLYAQRHSLGQCFETIGKEITEEILERYTQINDRYWKRLELGEVTQEELFIGRFRTLFEECKIQGEDARNMAEEYQYHLGHIYRLIDDSLEICRMLKSRVKQYVVTNGIAETQMNKLKLSGLYDVMDGFFISESIGTPKPQKGFFDYCLEHVEEKDKRRILLVGDSLSSDIRGGVQAGIPTCWYRPEGTENPSLWKPDYEVSDLHMIREVLGFHDI
ncbi:MAG: YjjG family noncanonical pyrimidine nucleotidase [Bacteroidales bacterium]|nr:YjjG family noncanonical pyrimidine nucleotidase [Lachnoclostridium sp.]MCM1384533.1 YjjG family noncanonical pyrimidine nucleotidase [Lachnoclostridium sp.]MCM1464077.1 YjjG family noncanonical pyrimidine nucleotidase [Bacteroidales bacterium]